VAIGIIAEYNPFHAGHAYQLAEAKKLFPHEEIIVVMSGNFTQRGEPAILDKFTRAKLAVEGGADLILELPFTSAVRSAQDFAHGALNIFEKLNVVDKLIFGAETSDLKTLQDVAGINFSDKIKQKMSTGISYAAAISKIFSEITGVEEKFFKQANTILAIEYLRNLPCKIEPILIQRVGAGYHEKTLQNFSSASAIRAEVYKKNPNWQKISKSISPKTLKALQAEKISGLVCEEFLFRPILSKITCSSPEEMRKIFGMNEGLENLIIKSAKSAKNFQDLVNGVVNKRYSESRVKRLFLYFLFDITAEKIFELDSIIYARILAFNQRGQKLLKKISHESEIELLTKIAPHFKKKSSEVYKKLAFDVKSSNLYGILFETRKNFFDDLKKNVIKV